VGFNDSQVPNRDADVRIAEQRHLLDLVKGEGGSRCGRMLVLRQQRIRSGKGVFGCSA
jgi:hypothetical protein